MSTGSLRVEVYVAREALPVPGAQVEIYQAGEWQTGTPLARLTADSSGQTEAVQLNAPNVELSLYPYDGVIPYSTYDVVVRSSGYQSQVILKVQVFAGVEALQQIELVPIQERQPDTAVFEVPIHHLAGPGQPNLTEYANARILSKVVIPQYVTVHLGRPSDTSVGDVTVSFRNYIKNVASSEIYPTWPENALRANIYCQISLVLNRIFTEWYRSRGYNFDITSSTSYDQSFVNNRDIFSNISKIVDQIFDTYIQKNNFTEPFYAEYCDGKSVTCAGLKQWGTVTLANQGYSPLGILRYYYGDGVSLVQATEISGTPQSHPGTLLRRGSSGAAVRVIQQQLNLSLIHISEPTRPY